MHDGVCVARKGQPGHEPIFFVYVLKFKNGKVYVGMSRTDKSGSFERRYRVHKHDAESGRGFLVHAAWRKHGAPQQEIIGVYPTREMCATAEIDAIKRYDSLNPSKGYNLMAGGEGLNAPPGSEMHKLMCDRVWGNPERRAKCSAALKGRKPSDATTRAYMEWCAANPHLKSEAARRTWQDPEYKAKRSELTKLQMTPEARAHLSHVHAGRTDPRTQEGKATAAMKRNDYLASERGKQACAHGQSIMWAKPENREKWKAGTDRWRASERNKLQCREMAKLSAAACSKRVRDVHTGAEYDSQRQMAKALGLSDATISLRVKAGSVIRI